MKHIQLIKNLELNITSAGGKTREAKEIFTGERRRIIEIQLREGDILPKHKAAEPITVLCLAGAGTFRAGADLSDELRLEAGTLITLEANVEHELVAEPEIKILVTRFKEN